ncbi:hypothetical protein D9758_002784 [Tetrapyrgos nigripes]|uniref:Uncharacterized protein n=1 Tax=Tetrapyrgos nigripes TaxID=182062 RepID=A0A8H5LTY2_9AGAR|nr:hypothetical protein D9758_002784 [Tetrapyrgos nigripes]
MSGEIEAPVEAMDVEPPKDASESANPDPASSLRAAALLTLKSKRRKPTNSQSVPSSTLPARPVAIDSSVQLDYGQEDSIASSPPQAADPENGQAREEGEISDSEMDPTAASAKATSSPTTSLPNPSTIPSVSDSSTETPPRPEGALKAESPPPAFFDRISDVVPPESQSASSVTDDANSGQRSYFIDADHVRPGLEMNQEQYDTAKDIVLDLLGWGVPPEYLVDCGLSREIVFYVFNELNLRIPENLDITGLVPYNPTTAKSLLRDPNAPPLGTGGLRSLGHPSLPPKPSTSVSNVRRPVPLPLATDSSQLNDMERQRRQELLARKAVISSRKGRSSVSESPSAQPTIMNDQDVEMTPLVPTETVDSFLKSIGSVSDDNAETSEDKMDVDDIPGLGGPSSHPSSLSKSMSPPDAASVEVDDPPPTTGESALSRPSEASSRRSSLEAEDQGQGSGRKSGKRPVAADFVDFDTAPRHLLNANGNGSIHPHLKRKIGGSFASISTMRRCVIDLSDSEGEDDGGNSRAGLPPMLRRMSVPLNGVGRAATPPNPPQSAGAALNRSKSPNTLAEKEAEIMKMKQMIAERERKKFKKGDTGSNSEANTPDTLVKQEDVDSVTQPAPENNAQDAIMSDSTVPTSTNGSLISRLPATHNSTHL